VQFAVDNITRYLLPFFILALNGAPKIMLKFDWFAQNFNVIGQIYADTAFWWYNTDPYKAGFAVLMLTTYTISTPLPC